MKGLLVKHIASVLGAISTTKDSFDTKIFLILQMKNCLRESVMNWRETTLDSKNYKMEIHSFIKESLSVEQGFLITLIYFTFSLIIALCKL